jgi:AP2 domain
MRDTQKKPYAIGRRKAAVSAWYWVVHFRRRGKLYSKRFYDLSYGGSAQAKAAALVWRDEQLAEISALTMREFHAQRRSNNTSGVPGVHFLTTAAQPQGLWQAKIKLPDGRKVHKSFSVRRFGYDEAFALAIKARAQLLQLIEDRAYLKHPLARKRAANANKMGAPRQS